MSERDEDIRAELRQFRRDGSLSEQLLVRVRRRVRGAAKGRGIDAVTDPSDLTQDTLLAALRHHAAFSGETENELVKWLLGILDHRATDVVRESRTRKRGGGRVGPLGEHDAPAAGDTPSQAASADEQVRRVTALLRQSPLRTQEVVNLHSLGHSFAEIGRRLNISDDAARRCYLNFKEQATAVLGNPD